MARPRSKASWQRTQGAERGQRAVDFIEKCCVHTIGKWAGTPFKLTPWQRDYILEVFGNVDRKGMRITRRAFLAIARKQGKSELAAAVALYLLLADGEPSPQVYGAAFDRDQASIVFDVAAQMVAQSPELRGLAKVIPSTKRIICTTGPSAGGYYRAIPADAAGSHGFNASGIIFDEFHTQKNRDLYDVLSTSTSAREQPLIFMITTAGFDKAGPCFEVYEYAKQVLAGRIKDKTMVARIFEVEQATGFETLAEQDSRGRFLREKDLWPLANPSLIGQPGGFVRSDEIRRAVNEAIHLPRARNHVLNLHFNVWTEAAETWLDMASWDRCGNLVDESKLKGESFYGGLDISHSQDFTAWCLLFPNENEDGETEYKALWRLWLPEDALIKRGVMKPTLDAWAADRYITICPGGVVDLRMVEQQIERDCRTFNLLELGYDRFHAHGIISELMEVLGDDKLADVGQSFKFMNAPCKELERLLSQGRINTGGNPVLRWMAANAVADANQDDLVRPSRKKSSDKIDGVVTLLMALNRAIAYEEEPEVGFYSFGTE